MVVIVKGLNIGVIDLERTFRKKRSVAGQGNRRGLVWSEFGWVGFGL